MRYEKEIGIKEKKTRKTENDRRKITISEVAMEEQIENREWKLRMKYKRAAVTLGKSKETKTPINRN